MKKKIIILAVATVMVLSCTACGNTKNKSVQLVTSEAVTEKADKNKSYTIPELSKEATISETVLVDEKGVKITATSLEYDRYSTKLNLTIENNTNMNLEFMSGTVGYDVCSVNGYMVEGLYLNADVAAGKKSNETITISSDELKIYGFEEIADIEIGFKIKDDDYNEYFQTGPRQVKTSAADKYDYSADPFVKAMKDKNLIGALGGSLDYFFDDVHEFQSGISVLNEMLITNKDGDKVLMFELVNNSSKDYSIKISDIYMNKLLVKYGTYKSDTITAGKRYVGSITLNAVTRDIDEEAFGLAAVSDMSFSVTACNLDYEELFSPDNLDVRFSDEDLYYDTSGTELYNENGLRIISKGLINNTSYSTIGINMMLLVENKSSQEIRFSTVRDSLSMNGYMIDFYSAYGTIDPNEALVLEISAQNDSLEKCGISSSSDVTEAEISFELRDSNNKIFAEPAFKITY